MMKWSDTWYLLRCHQRTWKQTLKALHESGVKTCCPIIYEGRRRTDKVTAVRHISYPAFPGYIFVCLNPEVVHTSTLLMLPGAMDFVRFGESIASVKQNEINEILYAEAKVLMRGDFNYQCIHVDLLRVEKIIEIYTEVNPEFRGEMLISLLNSQPKKRVDKNAA